MLSLALGTLKRWRIIAAGLLLLAAAGCSTLRLAYDQADTVTYWWLDGYVEFTPSQATRARAAIASWFAWHRGSQLADYAALLDQASQEVMHDTTPARVCQWSGEIEQRVDAAVDQALPSVAAIAVGLSAAQLEHLRAKQAKVADEWRGEFLQPDPRDRLAASVKRSVERAEQLYGPLDAGERELIAAGLAASPFDPERWIAERERRQADLRQALHALQTGALSRKTAVKTLREVWSRVQQSPDLDYQRYEERLRISNCELIAQLHNATSSEQRQTARSRLKGWAQDLEQLRPE